MQLKYGLSCALFLCCLLGLHAQDPARFQAEVAEILDRPVDTTGELIIFTGSSSIRMWEGLQAAFPNHKVLNHGFGGSEVSDLLHFYEKLILDYQPEQVFIYEGDNDLASGKSCSSVLHDFQMLINKLKLADPEMDIVLISPKPSISRWNYRDKYIKLNGLLEELADFHDGVRFVNVWTPMLSVDGELRPELFIKDGLHMNAKGYRIWADAIRPYLMP